MIQTSSGVGATDSSPPSYRLLYRGALSLPDSYIQLDGIAFSARLSMPNASLQQDSSSSPSLMAGTTTTTLMHNPLALALESMRGRQTLRFKGTMRMEDGWMDDSGDVYMDIHPFATLTRIYFENVLCLSPLVASSGMHDKKRTEVGVRVSLGDTDGPETTDIVIYGETNAKGGGSTMQLSPAAMSTSVSGLPPLNVRLARILPVPRVPRPDDPTPRQPPAHLLGTPTTLGDLGANKRILVRPNCDKGQQTKGTGKVIGKERGKGKGKEKEEEEGEEDQVVRRAGKVMMHLPRSNKTLDGNCKTTTNSGGGGGLRECAKSDAVFKVPEVPVKARRRKPGESVMDSEIGVQHHARSRSVNFGKGKGKEQVLSSAGDLEDSEIADGTIEGANKLVLKKLSVRRLADAGIPRSHSDFKEFYGFVYRGAAFALRSQMKTLHISAQAAEAVVEAHVKMYVPHTNTTDGP